MKSRNLLSAVVVMLAVPILATACGSDNTPSAPTYPQMPGRPAVTAPQAQTSKLGDTVELTYSNYDGTPQVSDFTAKSVHNDGDLCQVDLVLQNKQGETILGVFVVLTDKGTRLKEYDEFSTEPGHLDNSGTLLTGERREGYLPFKAPTGQRCSKLVYSYASNTMATWILG